MSKGTVLIVDDDAAIVLTVQAALEDEGYHALTASSETVIQAVLQAQPDLILLDMMMPHPDGGELSLTLHALQETAEIPLILMSAAPSLKTLSTVLPVAGYLPKPFNLADLCATVAHWVSIRHDHHAASAQTQPPQDDPPRRPLRIRVSARPDASATSSPMVMAWRVLDPEEPQYQEAYQEAAHSYHVYGWPMPYAESDLPITE